VCGPSHGESDTTPL